MSARMEQTILVEAVVTMEVVVDCEPLRWDGVACKMVKEYLKRNAPEATVVGVEAKR